MLNERPWESSNDLQKRWRGSVLQGFMSDVTCTDLQSMEMGGGNVDRVRLYNCPELLIAGESKDLH